MEQGEYQNIRRQEEGHFYYQALHRLMFGLLAQYNDRSQPLTLLDAGCGTGFFAARLQAFGKVEAVDISPEACELARQRGIRATEGTLASLPFADATFDAAFALDVLYHRAVDDRQALAEILRVLKPGGWIFVRVPACPSLFSGHDLQVQTRERYRQGDLTGRMSRAGFEVKKCSFTGLPLLPAALWRAALFRLGRTKPASAVMPVAGWLNELLYRALSAENRFILAADVPFGIGLVAVGRKPA